MEKKCGLDRRTGGLGGTPLVGGKSSGDARARFLILTGPEACATRMERRAALDGRSRTPRAKAQHALARQNNRRVQDIRVSALQACGLRSTPA